MTISSLAGAIVGAVLLLGAVAKWLNLRWFAGVVASYAVAPRHLSGLIALSIAVAESVIGVTLVLGQWPGLAGPAAMLLLGVVTAVVAGKVAAGGTGLSCGCFGRRKAQGIGWPLVIRNAGLISLAGLASVGPTFFAPPIDVTALALGVLLVVLPEAIGRRPQALAPSSL